MGESGCKFEIIYETLNQKDNVLSVAMLCDIAGVSRFISKLIIGDAIRS